MKNKKSILTFALLFICLLVFSFISKLDFAGGGEIFSYLKSADSVSTGQNYELKKKSKKRNEKKQVNTTTASETGSEKVKDYKSLPDDKKKAVIDRILDKSLLDKLEIVTIDEEYTSKEEVSAYLLIFDKLPNNYHSKKERNFDSEERTPGGNVYMIGGDRFMNFEEKLPETKNRKYYECDLYDNEKNRGPFRLVYSNDGLIYYTDDHYDSFTLIVDKSGK